MPKNKLQLQLRGSGVIIKGDTPPQIAKEIKYGFWSTAENSNFYGDDVKTAADVIPRPEQYMLVPFRFISATIVGKESWKATKFTADALKASMDKLLGAPVYTDHDTSTVGNCIGHIESVEWQEEYTDESGNVIPAGINGNYAIDCTIAPNIARNLYTGSIGSNSVTVEFYWEPSHQFPDNDFYYKIGSYDDKGNPICRVVTEILQYLETSPVFRGADPFAKKLDSDGKVIKPDMTMAQYSKEEADEKFNATSFEISCKNEINVLRLSKSQMSYQQQEKAAKTDGNDNNSKSVIKMNKEFLLFVMATLGLTEEITEMTEDMQVKFTAAIKEQTELAKKMKCSKCEGDMECGKCGNKTVTENALEVADLLTRSGIEVTSKDLASLTVVKTADLESGKVTAQNLQLEVDRLKPLAQQGEAYITELRAEAERLHNVAANGKTIEATLNLIKTADIDVVKGLIESFGGQITSHQYKATCTKCGTGDNVSFQLSQNSNAGTGNTIVEDGTPTYERVVSKFEKDNAI